MNAHTTSRISQQNAHINAAVHSVAHCVETLIERGFTVLSIAVEGRRPIVWIQHTAHCRHLTGAWYRVEQATQGCVYTWQADLDGCRVQWRVRS